MDQILLSHLLPYSSIFHLVLETCSLLAKATHIWGGRRLIQIDLGCSGADTPVSMSGQSGTRSRVWDWDVHLHFTSVCTALGACKGGYLGHWGVVEQQETPWKQNTPLGEGAKKAKESAGWGHPENQYKKQTFVTKVRWMGKGCRGSLRSV